MKLNSIYTAALIGSVNLIMLIGCVNWVIKYEYIGMVPAIIAVLFIMASFGPLPILLNKVTGKWPWFIKALLLIIFVVTIIAFTGYLHTSFIATGTWISFAPLM